MLQTPLFASTQNQASDTDSITMTTSSSLSSSSSSFSDTKNKSNTVKNTNRNAKIEKWFAKQSKSEILFLLTSFSGKQVTVYDKFGSINRLIRVSIDGQHLLMGEQTILLNKATVDISLGIKTKNTNNNRFDCQPNSDAQLQSDDAISANATDDDLTDYIYNSMESFGDCYDFEQITRRYAKGQMIASNLDNTANRNHNLNENHCITLHISSYSSATTLDSIAHCNTMSNDIVLEFDTVSEKYIWAKGLSKLIAKKQTSKKTHRHKIIAYVLDKHSKELNYHTAKAIKCNLAAMSANEKTYFENRRRCTNLMKQYILVKNFQKHTNHVYDDTIGFEFVTLFANDRASDICTMQLLRMFWKSLFDTEGKYVRKMPKKYATMYRRRMKRRETKNSTC